MRIRVIIGDNSFEHLCKQYVVSRTAIDEDLKQLCSYKQQKVNGDKWGQSTETTNSDLPGCSNLTKRSRIYFWMVPTAFHEKHMLASIFIEGADDIVCLVDQVPGWFLIPHCLLTDCANNEKADRCQQARWWPCTDGCGSHYDGQPASCGYPYYSRQWQSLTKGQSGEHHFSALATLKYHLF